jgi:hypothetical protein
MYSDVTLVFTFRVPTVFKDDLAQLKENDLVFVSGQLTCDVPPFKLDDGQANIQACSSWTRTFVYISVFFVI